jgi:hypothetical protein
MIAMCYNFKVLSNHNPKEQHFNIMWNISHPDMVTSEEYDQVFIASQLGPKL